jgi:hypothetical protein
MLKKLLAFVYFQTSFLALAGGTQPPPLQLSSHVVSLPSKSLILTVTATTNTSTTKIISYGGCSITFIVRNSDGQITHASSRPAMTFPRTCSGELNQRNLMPKVSQNLYSAPIYTLNGSILSLKRGRYTIEGLFRINGISATDERQILRFNSTFDIF